MTPPADHGLVGTWEVEIRTPIGRLEVEMTFASTASGLTGLASGRGETVPLSDVRVEPGAQGVVAHWDQSITKPIRLNLAFEVTLDGDRFVGVSRAGRLPASKVTGRRVEGA